jgi:hypothetical protein
MPRLELSVFVEAPATAVAELYRDYGRWHLLFPTIRSARLSREEEGGRLVLAIDHREGEVVNVMTSLSPTLIRLEEWKKRFDAVFLNSFEEAPGGTRYRVSAEIRLKGLAWLLGPLLGPYIAGQIRRYVLEPVKRAAEERS